MSSHGVEIFQKVALCSEVYKFLHNVDTAGAHRPSSEVNWVSYPKLFRVYRYRGDGGKKWIYLFLHYLFRTNLEAPILLTQLVWVKSFWTIQPLQRRPLTGTTFTRLWLLRERMIHLDKYSYQLYHIWLKTQWKKSKLMPNDPASPSELIWTDACRQNHEECKRNILNSLL